MARVPKSGLREVHIDIGSHNANPGSPLLHTAAEIKRSIEAVADKRHARFIAEGNSEKVSATKTARYLTSLKRKYLGHTSIVRYIDSLIDAYQMRLYNPAPRIGTARPRRVSQITKKAPSKRLVARRSANTRKGYFPNPTSSELHTNFKVAIAGAIEDVTKSRPGIARASILNKQARVSYAQGLINAGHMLGVLDKGDTDDFMRLLKQSWQGQQ